MFEYEFLFGAQCTHTHAPSHHSIEREKNQQNKNVLGFKLEKSVRPHRSVLYGLYH